VAIHWDSFQNAKAEARKKMGMARKKGPLSSISFLADMSVRPATTCYSEGNTPKCRKQLDYWYKTFVAKSVFKDIKLTDFHPGYVRHHDNKHKKYKDEQLTHEEASYLAMKFHYNEQFIKETGFNYLIEDKDTFYNDDHYKEKMVKLLKEQGLNIAKNQLGNKQHFLSALRKNISKEVSNKFKNKFNKIDPNLSWSAFQKTSYIQDKMKSGLGDVYIKNISLDLNNKSFYKKVITPNVNKKKAEIKDYIKAQLNEYEKGGKKEEEASEALRAILVPAISMSLSLFLVLVTIIKVPFKVIKIISCKKPQKKENLGAVFAGVLMLLLFTPVLLTTNKYTDPESSTQYFLQKINEKNSYLLSFVIKWTLSVQPAVYLLGEQIESVVALYPVFHEKQSKFISADAIIGSKI
jgi:hypothetical protein